MGIMLTSISRNWWLAVLRKERCLLSTKEAAELMLRAYERCPHSNATRGNIEVNLQVDGVGVNAPQTRHIRQVELRQ
jgi:hypothetical protein